MVTGERPPSRQSRMITAVGIDHVRLSYLYVDDGDLDGFASLVHENIQFRRPDAPPGRGRTEVLKMLAPITGPPGRHHLERVIADGDCVAAVGRFTLPGKPVPVDLEFADFFTISADGLLLGCRRFYYLAPA